MFKELKISTKIAVAATPLAFAIVGLIAAVAGSGAIAALGAVIALAAIIASGVLLWMVGDSLTKRIDVVSGAAQHMSQTQLPALVGAIADGGQHLGDSHIVTINDTSPDEIGQLASSLNAAQASMGELVTAQSAATQRGVSEIFVTLARRNRALVDRQLALLDDLESDVEDQALLGDYYKLDHLATRMRRNAESLLVLARAETRRRRSEPVSIDDVIRAGISEIEDYQRARALTIDNADVLGPVVGDLAHMLAELLDNATSFSPPGSEVSISGAIVPGGYTVSIRDLGIGITPDRLAELNALLQTAPTIGLSVEPTLGLSVVSLLTEKHGAHVELHAGADVGTLVTVFLPRKIFAAGDFVDDMPAHSDAIDVELQQLIAAGAPVESAVLPPPVVAQGVASPPAPPHPAPQVPAPPVVAPIAPAAPAAPVALDAGLPARTPGAATPNFDEGATRSVPGEAPLMPNTPAPVAAEHLPVTEGNWDAAIDSLAHSASIAEPLPTFSLPTRSPGQTPQVDDTPMPAAQNGSDPEALRSKLNAFRSMSNAPAPAPATVPVVPPAHEMTPTAPTPAIEGEH